MSSAEENATVVLVDDEEMVLTSLSSFLMLETEYDVHTFTSAKDALAFITDNEVNIVISDYLMPETDGITFLGQVRDIKPEIPRIILTGYADKENAIKAGIIKATDSCRSSITLNYDGETMITREEIMKLDIMSNWLVKIC